LKSCTVLVRKAGTGSRTDDGRALGTGLTRLIMDSRAALRGTRDGDGDGEAASESDVIPLGVCLQPLTVISYFVECPPDGPVIARPSTSVSARSVTCSDRVDL